MKSILERLREKTVLLDGGLGTMLQAQGLLPGEKPEEWNLTNPQKVQNVHRAYALAGCDAVMANTFGLNRLRFGDRTEFLIRAAIENARKGTEGTDCLVALDLGPCGRMLRPLGDLDFEEAVSVFGEVARYAQKYGADFIAIETMNDAYETKAALLGVKENCTLPVFVTNVYDASGKLMTGAEPEAMIALLEGMGADAVGMNCSLGPRQMLELLPRFIQSASVPVVVCPNAGLPVIRDGKTQYDVDSEEFADCMARMADLGAGVLGGCCGTTPEYIRRVAERLQGRPAPEIREKTDTVVSSYTHAVTIGSRPVVIGERLNPTGKPRLKQALKEKDMPYLLTEGLRQADMGADILDVNVGLPGIDEGEMMALVVQRLQEVTDLPLQLDSADPLVLEKALRLYNGKAMINSVNGKEESMAAVLPLAKKYGGVVVALTLDEQGIPDTAQGRLEIARKIVERAEMYGIRKKDIVVDTLTMAVSADPKAALVTLESVRLVKEELGVKTCLGISNVSFGLPQREELTAAFYAMALQSGLNAAIMNPCSGAVMQTYHSCLALMAEDKDCAEYIAFSRNVQTSVAVTSPTEQKGERGTTLKDAVVRGLKELAGEKTKLELETKAPMEVIDGQIIPALDEVGRGFEQKTIYLPQLLMSAEAASAAFEVVKAHLGASGQQGEEKGTVVIATVKGDIHDIGKNIVKVLLENYGYRVIDLGRDVPPETVVQAAKDTNAPLVGLSALMTTTVPSMEETVRLVHARLPDCKVVVGGAVLTEEYARQMGADKYAADAMETVRYAEEVFGE